MPYALKRLKDRIGLISCSLLLATSSIATAQSTIPPVIHDVFPFPEMLEAAGDQVQVDPAAVPGLFYKVATDVSEKQVTIAWTLRQPGAQTGNDLWRATAKSVETVSYWPTAVVALSATELIVTGYDHRGITRIERWDVTLPTIVVDASGKEHLRTFAVARSDVLMLFETGKEAVCVLEINRGATRSVLLQFWDSRDVYRLDIDTATLTLQVSATQRAGVLSLPQLADAYLFQVWTGDHILHGYTYILMSIEGRKMPIALFDGDRDGTLDSGLSVDAATSLSMGLYDGTQYQ